MKILFIGTPDFALPTLEMLNARHTVAGVVTTPDKPRNHNIMTPTSVAHKAAELGIPVHKPATLKDGAILPILESAAPDLIVVVAYGKILPDYVLNFAKYGCINVHGSLLPAYRGAAPMQRAIMDGVERIGVTIMKMDAGLDTGDILLQSGVELPHDANFEWVHDTLAELGAQALADTLDAIDSITPRKQDDALATYAAKITKEECRIDFSRSAADLHNFIRALSPVPYAYTRLNGKLIKVAAARDLPDFAGDGSAPVGTIINAGANSADGFVVACGSGALLITEVVPEGKHRMSAADFLRGRAAAVGDVFE